MAETVARVIAVDGPWVWLEADPAAACSACAAGGGCGALRRSRPALSRVAIANDFDAAVGEHVVVGIAQGELLRASFAAYLIPLASLILGAIAGDRAFGGDLAAALGALAGLLAGLGFARRGAAILNAGGGLTPIFLRRAGPETLRGEASGGEASSGTVRCEEFNDRGRCP